MKMAKRPVPLYDFKAFGAAIKAARNEYGESRKKVSDELYISPRYLANIENKGQQPSLQVFYDLVTRYHISVDQFFFPNSNAEKSTGRRQLDALLDGMSDKGIRIVTATAREITEVEQAEDEPHNMGSRRLQRIGAAIFFCAKLERECNKRCL
jgi:transcriptional regulator with XRE-family HTH domain